MSNISVKRICNKIWEVEKKNDLFNQKIQDVYFWKLIRNKFFKKILEKNNIYSKNIKISFFEKLKNLFNRIKWSYFYGAINRKTQTDILIFESPRKKLIDGEYIDIYTNYLGEELKNLDYELIESPYRGEHYNKKSELRSYNDYFSLSDFIKYKIFGIKLTIKEKGLIKKIKTEYSKSLGVELDDFEKFITDSINDFYYQYNYYDNLLKKRRPEIIYLICSYGQEALIAACKKNNIKSIEIQHGIINKYHLGYSFPNNKNIPYFPDEMGMFGGYWYESASIPLKKDKVFHVGYPFMENRLQKFKETEKNNKQILFISQHTISDKLVKVAYDFALNNSDYKVIYKLHPAENNEWKEKLSLLSSANKLDNFTIIKSEKIDLYKLFLESEYLVGVYSTAIYEGLVLNCKTILINLPGIAYMEFLIEKKFVKVVNNSAELLNEIKEDQFSEIEKDYFFKNLNIKDQYKCL